MVDVKKSPENACLRKEAARHRLDFSPDNVEAGREYVKAYVTFIHYVERIYQATKLPIHGHAPEPGPLHEEGK